jgi:hypothetical protein
MSLDVDEFLRRFLLHVVPSRFVRIRYYGFLANRSRHGSLERARRMLDTAPPSRESRSVTVALCPQCGEGRMQPAGEVPPEATAPSYQDSS